MPSNPDVLMVQCEACKDWILGFVSLVLVLWTPVVVPLLPTLVQNWAEHNSSNFAVLACIIGLYRIVMILIALWGKRIRGYEDPLKEYGLELTSAKQIQNFFRGLVGGVMLVLLIQSTNVLVGSMSISWPTIPSSTDDITLLKLFGVGLRIVGQGLLTTTVVALVEEMLFRSWLPGEIAADLGFNQGIIVVYFNRVCFTFIYVQVVNKVGLYLFGSVVCKSNHTVGKLNVYQQSCNINGSFLFESMLCLFWKRRETNSFMADIG